MDTTQPTGHVVAVASNQNHNFSKILNSEIVVVTGMGVQDDAHQGITVKHRSRVAIDPSQPNLRQVHLIQAELFDDLAQKNFAVGPGELGENITTYGINLLALPRETLLRIGTNVVLEITGLRNPCAQIECFKAGLLAAVLDKGPDGELIRKAGIMTIVKSGGVVRPEDGIFVELPPLPHIPLERV